jgi:hypothetical protein
MLNVATRGFPVTDLHRSSQTRYSFKAVR